jgi:hypothetical protein
VIVRDGGGDLFTGIEKAAARAGSDRLASVVLAGTQRVSGVLLRSLTFRTDLNNDDFSEGP